MRGKYPRIRFEKNMTAYLRYEVDVLKTKNKKTNDYCRVSTGFRLIPKEISVNYKHHKRYCTDKYVPYSNTRGLFSDITSISITCRLPSMMPIRS